MVRLNYLLDSWRQVRQDTVAVAEEFPGEDQAFRERMSRHAVALPAAAGQPELAGSIIRRTAALTALLQMTKEHEVTHGAQLFLCLRMQGMAPSTTRRRLAKGAAK